MSSPFKMKYGGASALLKTLVGDQKSLPPQLKKAIEAAPESSPAKLDPKEKGGKEKKSPGRTMADMRSGQYGTVRPMTDAEALAYGQKRGLSVSAVRGKEKQYQAKVKSKQAALTEDQKSRARFEGGKQTQMSKIITTGKTEKGIQEEAKKAATGKTPVRMNGGKKKRPGTGVRKEARPLTPSQKANIDAQNKKANANAKRTGRGTGLIKDPTITTKKKNKK